MGLVLHQGFLRLRLVFARPRPCGGPRGAGPSGGEGRAGWRVPPGRKCAGRAGARSRPGGARGSRSRGPSGEGARGAVRRVPPGRGFGGSRCGPPGRVAGCGPGGRGVRSARGGSAVQLVEKRLLVAGRSSIEAPGGSGSGGRDPYGPGGLHGACVPWGRARLAGLPGSRTLRGPRACWAPETCWPCGLLGLRAALGLAGR
ncbi:collagen alpha-1(III) chain [Streptomyces sp. SPB074]|nr:collagen alpha-1(III) chain [Streptomyces sp. SPB074]